MTYPITWRGMNGQTGLVAQVRRIDDEKYWDESGASWGALTANRVALTESSAGVYTGTASFTPGPGVTYEIDIQDSTGASIIKANIPYAGEKKTALQHVNDIQAALRMPLSADFSGTHAKLVLAEINKAITLMLEGCVWPEMKCEGTLTTVDGVSLYQLRPPNTQGAEIVERMQIDDDPPIVFLPDMEFRAYKAQQTSENQPVKARIYGRIGDALLLELSPTPDAAYEISYNAILRVPRLSAVTDVPVLDDDLVWMGGIAFCKKEQGQAYQEDMQMFSGKVQGQRDNISEPGWGDVTTR